MFILQLYDRDGTELHEGDLVKLSDGNSFTFFSRVKYLEEQQVIVPFHVFSYHSVIKIDKIPEGARKSSCEERFDIWYMSDPEDDNDAESFDNYHMGWLECEHLIEKRSFRIQKQ